MISLLTFRTCLRPLALVVGTGWLVASTGCYGWHAQARSVSEVIATSPSYVRLTLNDGEKLELRWPRVETDSLVGFVRFVRTDTFNQDSTRVAVLLASASRVETHGINDGRTMALTIGVAVGTLAFAYLIALAVTMGCSDPTTCN